MSTDLFDIVMTMTLVGSFAMTGVLALRLVVRRWFGAQIAYATWIAVPLAALSTVLPAPVQSVATFLHVTRTLTASAPAVFTMPAAIDWPPIALTAWIVGALASCLAFAVQQRRYLRTLGRLRTDTADRSPRILRAESVQGCPALIGAWRPRIVLPGDFDTRYAPRERELILAHEQVHLLRGDARINAVVAALRCLNWFNPLIHVAAARFRFDQELACDAAVIARFPEARRPYADAMLKTQLAGQSRQELRLPVGCRWPSDHPLKERIAMLKYPLPTRTRRMLGTFAVAGAVLCATFLSWAAQPARTNSSPAASVRPVSENVSFRTMKPPAYPPASARARMQGNVRLRVHVKENGDPESAEVVSVEPPEATGLSDAAVAAVMQWRFNPAIRDGVAVAGDIEVPVSFGLDDDDAGGGATAMPAAPSPTSVAASYRRLSPPAYPASAITNHVEGIVYVKVALAADGRVTSATVDHVEPPVATVFGDAATNAVKKWQFNAPTHDGKAVAGYAVVPLRFTISGSKTIKPSALPSDALDIIDVVARPAS